MQPKEVTREVIAPVASAAPVAAPRAFLRNCWYVAAWSHEVAADALFSRTILDQSILLFRRADGTVAALDNRCAHRHAPLSLGRREGDCVRCMYHGLKFDADGRCVDIPGQAAIPSVIRVRSYPVVETKRWIWIWTGDPAKADRSLIPDTFSLDHPDWRMKPGYMHYRANHLLIGDNILDFSHLSYVHEKSLGGTSRIAETRAQMDKLPDGVRLTRHVLNVPPAPYHLRLGAPRTAVDRWWIYDYTLPGILLLDSGLKPVAGAEGATLRFHSCQALTPETQHTTHYFFMQAHAFALDDAEVTENLYQGVVSAFDEDKRMVEAQQALIGSASPTEGMIALPMDAALAQYRRLYQKALAAEASGGRSAAG